MTPLELNNIIYTQDSPDNVDGTAQSVNNEVISEIQSDEMASAKKGTKSKKDTPRKIKAVKQREKENSTRKRSQIYPLLIFLCLNCTHYYLFLLLTNLVKDLHVQFPYIPLR